MIGAIPEEADCFQQRDYVSQLENALNTDDPSSKFQLLIGPGGVGKTQLAAYFARQVLAQKAADVVIWASASSRETVQSAYMQAITELTGADISDAEHATQRFLAWTQTTDQKWLVVLDDVATPATLRDLWPPKHAGGRVLVTTRRRDAALLGRGRKRISIGLFKPSEATRYLMTKLATHDRVEDQSEVAALAHDLGHLPLALAQAVAYLIDSNLSSAEYRTLLADRRHALHQLLPDISSLPDDHHSIVTATWSLSIEQADLLPPTGLARPVLQLASMLDPNGIPEAVITSHAALDYIKEYRTEMGASNPAADFEIDEAATIATLRNLHRLNLLDNYADNPELAVRIHSLVQRAVVESMPTEQLESAVVAAADGLVEIWPEEYTQSNIVRALRSNAEALYLRADPILLDKFCHDVLFRLGNSFLEAGLASAAVKHFSGLRYKVDQLSVPDRMDTYFIRLHMAEAMEDSGNIAGALIEYRSLLQDEIKRQGIDAEEVLHVRSILAESVGHAGDALGSVRAFEELLQDRIRIQGTDHESTLDTRRRLAAARSYAGDTAGAIAAFQELLADEIRIHGSDHHQTRHTYLHLAEEMGRHGDVDGAIGILERIVNDDTRIHGKNSKETFGSRHRLGEWYLEDKRITKAVDLFQKLLDDHIGTFGEGHPHTLEIQIHLADALGSADEIQAAISTSLEILNGCSIDLGAQHPSTLDARGLVAHWKGRSGDKESAINEFSKILEDSENILGVDHPQTIRTLGNLASWLLNSGNIESANLAYRRLLNDRLRIHGANDRRVLKARDYAAFCMLKMGDFEGALLAFRELHADQVRILGEFHPDTVHTMEHIQDMES
ncbi:tetratricopeptide repeat protein [Streptosporangium sp. NPDC049078]|uniref:tetratricopeptide repeat protein n=1 Tax=Streptosporangium sp. NPDC049078 TaxID=3155767 RepID=UPI00343BC333